MMSALVWLDYPTLDRLGIPRTSRAAEFHTFRHSAASIVNHETVNLKLAQKFLGHSICAQRLTCTRTRRQKQNAVQRTPASGINSSQSVQYI